VSRAAVCIPVAHDPEGLRATLAALSTVDGAAEALVVVAVDGADPATVAVAESVGATCLALAESRGSYAARNAAIAALPDDVDMVLFTDAGCLPEPGWIRAHTGALDTAAMSGGAVEVRMSPRPTPAEWVDNQRNLRQQAYVDNDGFAATCNLAVRRKVLDAVTFDDSLRSGGDRDFGVRARAAGFDLVYAPDAVVVHPARSTAAEVLAKARRVGDGLATMPRHTRPARLPLRRPGLTLARRAAQRGLSRKPWWLARAAWIDNRRAATLHAAAQRRDIGLHVVVLLGSRWDALETFSTRWREVVNAWAGDERIDALTVVDHPRLRRRALVQRRLVESADSWLPGVERLTVTVPVDGTLRRTDGLAWWRTARQLRRTWPTARRRIVVAATPLAAGVLTQLHDAHTTTAFDLVDNWAIRARFARLADRVEAGYRAGARADLVTAVASNLADAVETYGRHDVHPVSNGVDVIALSTPAPPPPFTLPDRPFAVYLGTVGPPRLDVDLLLDVARRLHPDVPVVVAGPATGDAVADALRAAPVTWLGPVDTGHVPALLQAASCGLLPFVVAESVAMESMKVLQYLAAGLPIVSTDYPALPESVTVTRDAEEFSAAVRASVAGDGTRATPPPIPSWDDVARELLDHYLSAR
jgi:glycosyltransferase involved in cell wall biosynthesis